MKQNDYEISGNRIAFNFAFSSVPYQVAFLTWNRDIGIFL